MSTIPSHDNDTPKSPKPWYKRWWVILIAALLLIGIIGNAVAGDDSDEQAKSPTEPSAEAPAPAPAPTTAPSTPEWQQADAYQTYCTSERSIDPELQAIVDAVAIPDQGHIQSTRLAADSDNPEMSTVFFVLCSPAEGDDLRAIAEDLAIQVRQSDLGSTISEMGVNASYANPDGVENILRDSDFQAHLHDGGQARENGAYRAAWEARS